MRPAIPSSSTGVSNGPTDVRTGWGDLSLSASYTIPPAVLADFQVRVTGITKLPTGRRLGAGSTPVRRISA